MGLPVKLLKYDFEQFRRAALDLDAGRSPYQYWLDMHCSSWCLGGYVDTPLIAETLRPLNLLGERAAAGAWIAVCHVTFLLAVHPLLSSAAARGDPHRDDSSAGRRARVPAPVRQLPGAADGHGAAAPADHRGGCAPPARPRRGPPSTGAPPGLAAFLQGDPGAHPAGLFCRQGGPEREVPSWPRSRARSSEAPWACWRASRLSAGPSRSWCRAAVPTSPRCCPRIGGGTTVFENKSLPASSPHALQLTGASALPPGRPQRGRDPAFFGGRRARGRLVHPRLAATRRPGRPCSRRAGGGAADRLRPSTFRHYPGRRPAGASPTGAQPVASWRCPASTACRGLAGAGVLPTDVAGRAPGARPGNPGPGHPRPHRRSIVTVCW